MDPMTKKDLLNTFHTEQVRRRDNKQTSIAGKLVYFTLKRIWTVFITCSLMVILAIMVTMKNKNDIRPGSTTITSSDPALPQIGRLAMSSGTL